MLQMKAESPRRPTWVPIHEKLHRGRTLQRVTFEYALSTDVVKLYDVSSFGRSV